jgi:hypothetical protein
MENPIKMNIQSGLFNNGEPIEVDILSEDGIMTKEVIQQVSRRSFRAISKLTPDGKCCTIQPNIPTPNWKASMRAIFEEMLQECFDSIVNGYRETLVTALSKDQELVVRAMIQEELIKHNNTKEDKRDLSVGC